MASNRYPALDFDLGPEIDLLRDSVPEAAAAR